MPEPLFLKKILKIVVLAHCLFLSPGISISQSNRIDSLKKIIRSAKTSTEQLAGILQLCKEKNSLHGDSLLLYSEQIKKLAIQLKDDNALAYADYNFTAHLLSKGKIDSVLTIVDFNSKKIAALKDRYLYYKYQLLKANALNRKNRLNESLSLQLRLLKEAEKDNNINTQAFIYNYLGNTFLALNKPLEGKIYFFKGLHVIEKDGGTKHAEIQAYIYSNISLFFFNNTTNNLINDSALLYCNRAIDVSKKNEYLGVLSSSLVLKGNIFSFQNKFAEAEKLLMEGISIRNKIGDPFYQINDLINLASFYTQFKQYQKAITTIDEGLYLSDKNKIEGERLELLRIKAYNYKQLKNYELYSATLEAVISVSDSNNKLNATRQLAEIQTKYDVQEKETQIAKQKLSLVQRKYLLFGSAFILVFGIFASYISFKNYRARQKLKIELILQEEQKQKELAIRNAGEKERTRIAADLHDNIGVQASAILYGTELLKQGPQPENNVVSNLHDTAKEMLVNLRETLWAMKNTDIAAADLWLRVINFCKQMGRHYGHISITASGAPPSQFILASAQALNLMMIVQEAVNNAAKHAGANSITVSSYSKNNWQIKIEDDGNGFDIEKAQQKKDSNGLGNMQERANTAGVKICFESSNQKGTTISLLISIA